MSERTSIFKKMDAAIFELVNKYKASNVYAQISEQLSTLPEDQQKIIGQITNIFLIVFPAFLVLFFLAGNISKQADLEVKKSILKSVDTFLYNKNRVEQLTNSIVSPFKITDENTLKNRFTRLVAIPTQSEKPSIEIAEFNQEDLNDSFIKTNAIIEFSNLSSQILENLLKEILITSKLKVSSINIKKNEENSFIEGNIEIVHYGKK